MAVTKLMVSGGAEQPSVSGASPAQPHLQISNPADLKVEFDEEGAEDLRRLAREMGPNVKPEDVVQTALDILNVSIDYDVTIKSKRGLGTRDATVWT